MRQVCSVLNVSYNDIIPGVKSFQSCLQFQTIDTIDQIIKHANDGKYNTLTLLFKIL